MFATFGNVAGIEGSDTFSSSSFLDEFPFEKCKVKGLLNVLSVIAFVIGAVALHIFKIVPPSYGKKKLENMSEKIFAPFVHPRHFAQY
jgi:hypothetical protein